LCRQDVQAKWRIINLGHNKVSLIDAQDECRELPRRTFEVLVERGSLQAMTPAPGQSDQNRVADIINRASPNALREATRRYRLIASYLDWSIPAEPADRQLPERTRQRWIRQYRVAQRTHGIGFLGLLPGTKGNTVPKLPEATRNLLSRFIEDNYETLKQKGKFVVYGQYLLECERQGVQAASYRTFASEINRRPKYEQTLKRQGPRAAYSYEPFY
jgi:putative transposase